MAVKRNFAVFGLGAFGYRVCEVLVQGGGSVVAIDNNAQTVEKVKKVVSVAILIDTTSETELMKAPLDDVDVAIVAIGTNLQASILTTALLKQRDIPYILARATSPIHETILRKIGANEILNIEVASATTIAKRLVAPDVTDAIAMTDDISLREIVAPRFFTDKTLEELELREKFNVKIVAVVRTDMDIDPTGNSLPKKNIYYPDNAFTFRRADRMFVLGHNRDLRELTQI